MARLEEIVLGLEEEIWNWKDAELLEEGLRLFRFCEAAERSRGRVMKLVQELIGRDVSILEE